MGKSQGQTRRGRRVVETRGAGGKLTGSKSVGGPGETPPQPAAPTPAASAAPAGTATVGQLSDTHRRYRETVNGDVGGTPTPTPVSVTDLGSVSGCCDKCSRGIRYAVTMSSGETFGMDCAEAATSGRKVRATASTFRRLQTRLNYERRLRWEAEHPDNAAFAARFIEYASRWEMRPYREDFYAGTMTAEQVAEANTILDTL